MADATVNELHLGSTIYVLNHYTAGVILFGKREEVRRNSLSKINFDDYEAIVSFVNIQNTDWKFLYVSAAQSNVYLVDPIPTSTELADSDHAAKRLSEYLKMTTKVSGRSPIRDVAVHLLATGAHPF